MEITRSATAASQVAGTLDEAAGKAATAAANTDDASQRASQRIMKVTESLVDQHELALSLFEGERPTNPVRQALTSHGLWKIKLQEAIATQRVEAGIDLAVVARRDACHFGQWLATYQPTAEERDLMARADEAHAEFHRQAARVLTAVDQHDIVLARSLTLSDDGYAGAASSLTCILLQWAKLLGV